MTKNLDSLNWLRLPSPIFIPRYLVEQIKHKDFSVEDFYDYNKVNCIYKEGEIICWNAFNHLYALFDEDEEVRGFLWFIVSPLTKFIDIQSYSVDKEYWGDGSAMKKVTEFFTTFMNESKLEKVQWITNRPKYFEKYGFKRSKFSLMEFKRKING